MRSLTTTQRDELLRIYRKDTDPELRFRAHIILLLDQGHTWDTIEAMLFCSSRTLDRWKKRFEDQGVEGLTGRKRGRPFRFGIAWVAVLVSWVTTKTPRDFGFLRSRWSCAVLALLLHQQHDVKLSRETVRRFLHRGHLVYRRPRPVLKPDEEERQAKLAELRKLLEELPEDETAVWQDEVEVHTNPKIGQMWMLRGHQAKVLTPGTNKKRHLSGSIHWRTGTVFVTEAAPKQAVSSGSLSGHRRSSPLLMCLLENPVGRRMVAKDARLDLLVTATPGTGRLPPAIAPGIAQAVPQPRAQLGCRWHRAQ
jgi:putative transposase